MLVTGFTSQALAWRRFVRWAAANGYERVHENGAPLWELSRGARWQHVITDAKVAPDRQTLFVKIEPGTST